MVPKTPLRVLATNRFGRLLPAELALLEATETDGKAQCTNRRVRAEVIRWLLLSPDAIRRIPPSGLEIWEARIAGRGNLGSIHIPFSLGFLNCDIAEGLDLASAEVGGHLSFKGSRIGQGLQVPPAVNAEEKPAVNAEEIKVGRDLMFDGSIVCRKDPLPAAVIEGSLRCRRAHFSGGREEEGQKVVLHGNGMQVRGSLLLDEGFVSQGEIRLVGAKIGGNLRLSKGELWGNPSCLAAELIQIEGDIISSRFKDRQGGDLSAYGGVVAHGEVRFAGAHIYGNAEFNASKFDNGKKVALRLHGAEIGGTLSLARGFEAQGEVTLLGAKLGRNLNCMGGSFCNPSGRALNADGIFVTGFARLRMPRKVTLVLQAPITSKLTVRSVSMARGSRATLIAMVATSIGENLPAPRSKRNGLSALTAQG